MSDKRVFLQIMCHYCSALAVWSVYEWREATEEIRVCEKHKFSPWS